MILPKQFVIDHVYNVPAVWRQRADRTDRMYYRLGITADLWRHVYFQSGRDQPCWIL